MEPRDRQWDVDFVVGADDVADELLPEPDRRPLRRSPMLFAALAVAVALAVVGGVRLASGQHPSTPSTPHVAAPLVHAPRVLGGPAVKGHPGVGRASVLQPGPAVDRVTDGLRFCPDAGDGQSACSSSRHLPVIVLAALRDHLPGIRHVHGYEEQLRDIGYGPGGLWYRQVYARLGEVSLTITVARRRIPQPVEVLMLPQYVGFSFHRTGYFVRTLVHVHGPQLVPILRLMALTRDPRLRTAA
jgi:hypothetical protein